MKTNQTKTKAADPAKKSAPFFNKEAGQSYFQPIQPKLTVNAPNDPLEQEADRVADHVVQKMDKGTIGRKPIFESKNEAAEGGVLRKASGVGVGSRQGGVPASVEHGLPASKGGGAALPGATRRNMEQSMGADLSGVRVHDDDRAHRMSKDLGAQAFAHGKDIYFDKGKFSPRGKEGTHLLAHEVAHTLQQGAAKPAVQKTPAGGGAGGGGKGKGGKLPNFANNTITFDTLWLPTLKARNSDKIVAPLTRTAGYVREESFVNKKATPGAGASHDDSFKKSQTSVWRSEVKNIIGPQIDELLKKSVDGGSYDSKTESYFLIAENRNKEVSLIGTKSAITDASLIPVWNSSMKASAYDVDHIKELQLGGTNSFNNMELLNFSANRASGSQINLNITTMVDKFLSSTVGTDVITPGPDNPTPVFKKMPDAEKAMSKFDLVFKKVDYNDKNAKFSKADAGKDYWSVDKIKQGKHLKGFRAMDASEVKAAKGSETDPVIYTAKAGGRGMHVADFKKTPGIKAADYKAKKVDNQNGVLTLTIKPPNMTEEVIDVPVYRMPGLIFGGSIKRQGEEDEGGLETILKNLDFIGLSPVEVQKADIVPGKGIVMSGVISPTLEIIQGFDLDFFVEGNEFGVSKTIMAGDIHVPQPFTVTSAMMTVGAGSTGVFVDGHADFEISGLGKGQIRGLANTSGNFGIEGEFTFDKKLVKTGATIKVAYNNKEGWSIKGKLGLGDNIKGIKSGEIGVEYANKVLTATGTAQPSIKGMKDVKLYIQMGQDVTEIDGDVTIDKLPGIQKGEGHLKIVKTGDDFSFSGSGKITPDIPKLSSQIDFSFHDDVFSVDATFDYVNDRISGKLHVGITNQGVDDEGKPTGKKGEFTVFGGGQMSLKVTDNIRATAGVDLKPDGDIEIMGEIKLEDRFEVVPTLLNIQDKEIIPIPEIHIPLFGIPLGVKTIGLEATIAPKLTANVQLGPGSLTNVSAGVKYTLSQPDSLEITGGADFEFIAKAGITAGVDFKIDVDAGIAEVGGGVNLSAYIEAAAEQPVFHTDIKYSPKTGFELNGDVKALVKAKLGFSGDLILEASLGVSFLKKTWRWKKPLFNKDIDTGAEIGFQFPFSYKDGKGNADFDNLKFKYPTFDMGLLSRIKEAVVDPVKDQIF